MAKKKHIDITADGTQARTTIGQLEDYTKKSMKESARAVDKSSKDIAGAYKKMGIRTDESIRKSTKAAKDNYAKIKHSGTASAREIKAAHNKMTAKIKANNMEMRGGAGMLSKMYGSLKTKFVAFAAVAAAAAVTFATFTFGKKALSESIKFESALLDLQKVMDDTEGSAERFTGTVNKMAKKYGVSAAEILQGAANFKQAGFDLEEVFTLQAAALDLVIAGDIEAAQASDLLVASLKGFKAPASEATRLIDVMNEVSNRYATNLEELAIGMAEFSPIAAKMNLSFEETAGLLTPIIEIFRSGSEAAVALKMGMLRLVSDQAPVLEGLRRLEINQRKANGSLKSGRDILLEVAAAFRTVEETEKLKLTADLVGIRQAGKMVEVFDGLNKTLEITQVAMNATGSAAKEVAIRLGSTEKKIDKMKVTFSIMAKTVGDELKPALRWLVDWATTIIPIMTPIAVFVSGTLAAAFNIAKAAFLTASQGVLYFAKGIAFLTDKFGITNDATSTLNEMLKDMDKQMKKTQDNIARAGRKMIGLAEAEDKLTVATKKSKKEAEALEKRQQEVIDAYEESAKAAAEESDKRIEALKKQEDAQKSVNTETRKRISDAKQALKDLRSDITAIDALLESIRASMAAADVTKEQQGLTSAQVLIDNVNRAVELSKQADKAFKEGRKDEAIALTKAVIDARNAVASANKLEMQEAGISPAGLDEARELAERLAVDVQKMATTFSELQADKIPGATEEIAKLEVELTTGKEILKEYVTLIKEATTEATALKDKLSLDTTSTHTQIIKTVQAQSEGGPIQPIKAKTGRYLPGYGGGDRRHILGEDGEFMMRKEAVRDLGLDAAYAFNNRDIPALLASLAPAQRMAEGGPVKGPVETVNWNITAGGNTVKTTAPKDSTTTFMNGIKRMNIIYGRGDRVF
jgi:TP901 family phage tail tape measure protein